MFRIVFVTLFIFILIPFALVREKRYVRNHRQDVDLRKRSAVLWILRSVLLALLIAAGFLIYKADYEKKEIGTYDRETASLVIYEIGAPGFPFGDSACRLVLKQDGKQVGRMDFSLANDGKRPDEGNFSVVWREDGVAVTASGEEQEDRTYVLYFEGAGTHVLDAPQEFRANLISWGDNSFRVIVCDPMENTVFPDGAQLTVDFDEGTYFIDLDGSVTRFDPDRKFYEPTVGRKLKWVEGMVLQIEFTAFEGYSDGNGFYNHAAGKRIENVDVIAIPVE